MSMFPIFLIGLLSGIVLASLFWAYKKSSPSSVSFDLQNQTIDSLKEDISQLENQNKNLLDKIEKLKIKK